jgi:probable HAF family extracellular repeat protein
MPIAVRALVCTAALASIVLPGAAQAAPQAAPDVPSYLVVHLPTLDAPDGFGGAWTAAVNDRGDVVGTSYVAGTVFTHAVLWRRGQIVDLGVLPGGSRSTATGINNRGQVVGFSDVGGGITHPFLWQHGRMTDLGSPTDGSAWAQWINNKGEITGNAAFRDPTLSAPSFVWSRGSFTPIALPGEPSMEVHQINDGGQVVGTAALHGPGMSGLRAFVWRAGVLTEVPTLGGRSSLGTAINGHGRVIGYADLPQVGVSHGFVWRTGVPRDLNPSGDPVLRPTAIDDRGRVFGFTIPDGFGPFLWRHGVIVDLTAHGLGRGSRIADVNSHGVLAGVFDGNRFPAQPVLFVPEG